MDQTEIMLKLKGIPALIRFAKRLRPGGQSKPPSRPLGSPRPARPGYKLLINKMLGPYQFSRKVGSFSYPHELLKEKYRALVEELAIVIQPLLFWEAQPTPDEELPDILAGLSGITVTEALYLHHSLTTSLSLPGDVCEFGCSSGNTSRLIARTMKDTGKSLWLYDTFSGLPGPGEKDVMLDDVMMLGSIGAYQGTMKGSPQEVFAKVENTGFETAKLLIVQGLVEDSIAQGKLPASICFAYLDMDFYAPTVATLQAIEARVAPGGILFLDDYGYFTSGVSEAVKDFLHSAKSKWTLLLPEYGKVKYCMLRKEPGFTLESKCGSR